MGLLQKNFTNYVCKDKHNTITFIKVKGADEILGGYNPIEWKNYACGC